MAKPQSTLRPCAVLAMVLVAWGCGGRRPTNLLLVVVDTLRADRVGCYGATVATPNIDALAARGVRFERAYSHIPITGPSHASMFTSQLPLEHGVRNNTQVLPGERQTLAEALRDEGLRTAGFITLGVLHGKFGFGQGFQVYRGFASLDHWQEASAATQEAVRWLGKVHDEPWFLWVHYSDPHGPLTPPGLEYPEVQVGVEDRVVGTYRADGRVAAIPLRLDPGTTLVTFSAGEPPPPTGVLFRAWRFRGADVEIERESGFAKVPEGVEPLSYRSRLPATVTLTNHGTKSCYGEFRVALNERLSREEQDRRYGLEVEHVDREIGRLLAAVEEVGQTEDTLVVFTSDHGEGLGDHDHGGHISQLYDTLLRVPLVISYPRSLPSDVVLEGPVRHIDLAPTILDLMDVANLQEARGESLLPLIQGDGGARAVVAATYRPEAPQDLRALVTDGFKVIIAPGGGEVELYDLSGDPGELADLGPEQLERLRVMTLDLESRFEGENAAADGAELSEEEKAALRGLGYVH